jgi:hypothetical protein
LENLYLEPDQIKENVIDMLGKAFRSRFAHDDESVWMKKVFPEVKNKHRFMADGEEILDVDEIMNKKKQWQEMERKRKDWKGYSETESEDKVGMYVKDEGSAVGYDIGRQFG